MQAQALLQEINYDGIFVDGSLRQIRLRTITLRVMPITGELRCGSSEAAFTRIGNQQVLNRFSGFMENVRPSQSSLTLTPPNTILHV